MDNLKVCFLSFSNPIYGLHGAYSSYEYLASALTQLGHRVFVVTASMYRDRRLKHTVLDGVNTIRVQVPTMRNKFDEGKIMFSILCLKELSHLSSSVDIIHAAYGYEGLGYGFAKIGKKARLVSTFHDVIWGERLRASTNLREFLLLGALGFRDFFIAKRSDALIATTRRIAEEVCRFYGISHEKISYIPLGVNTDVFRPDITLRNFASLRREAECILMFAGALVPSKGLHIAIKAMRKITNTIKSIKLVVAGPLRGGYVQCLLRLAKELNIEDKVVFLGKVKGEDMPELFCLCDVYIHPATYATSSTALTEALASGVAIVASRVSGPSEYITHMHDGVLVPPGDVDALAEAVTMILTDKGMRKRLMYNARRTAVEKYDWLRVAERTVRIYERLLQH